MALVVQGAYTFPEPDIDGYHSTKIPITQLKQNAKGVRIGEFVKWQYGVSLKYDSLLGADYHAMVASAEGVMPGGVSTTFYDDDSGTYLTKTMLLESVVKELYGIAPEEEYINVTITLLEL